MKSEHRHELKTNELAEWLRNLPQWFRENSKTIIVVTILAIVILSYYGWRRYDKNVLQAREQTEFTQLLDGISSIEGSIVSAQQKGMDYSYELITHANNLKMFAETARRRNMAAMALIKYGDILRKELHYRLEPVTEQDKQEQINRAKESYNQAIQKDPSNPALLAAAKFGLGLCAEELGDFDQAGRMYREIASNEAFEGTVIIVQAKERLDNMSDYEEKIVFMPAPVKEPEAAAEPMVKMESVDANKPAGVGLPFDTNIPEDVNLMPQSSDNIPPAPDVSPMPLSPDVVSEDSDANVPVE
jgi:tetratricopeptide (TPR) repeat protein